MEALAFGELGLSQDAFYGMTPRQFGNLVMGYRRKEERHFKESWERARAIAATSLIPHIRKGRSRNITKIFPLPWDNEKGETVRPADPKKELERVKELWERVDAQSKVQNSKTKRLKG